MGVNAEEERAGNTGGDKNVNAESTRYAKEKKGGIRFVTTAETEPCRRAGPLMDVPPVWTRQARLENTPVICCSENSFVKWLPVCVPGRRGPARRCWALRWPRSAKSESNQQTPSSESGGKTAALGKTLVPIIHLKHPRVQELLNSSQLGLNHAGVWERHEERAATYPTRAAWVCSERRGSCDCSVITLSDPETWEHKSEHKSRI